MAKIGRNDKCPCGSGLKYKKCCLNRTETHNQSIVPAQLTIPTQKIDYEDESGFYRMFRDEYVEKVNPIEYYQQHEVEKRAVIFRDILNVKAPNLTSDLTDSFFVNSAKKSLEEEHFWEQFEDTELNDNFLKLLGTAKKKDQEALLKGLSITPNQLMSLIFKSYRDYGYLYSKYRFEHIPKGMKDRQKPVVSHITDEGIVKTIGETELTNGEIKNLIEQRKVIVSHFFDKDNNWHCLFTTYNSIGGKENYKGGQPHLHYISSAFGISRDDFIESMKNGQYKSTSIHIDLLEYGNQTIDIQKQE